MLSSWARRAPILLLLAVSACNGSPDPSTNSGTPPSAATGLGDRNANPTTGKTREITATYGFTLPSRNIGCLMTADAVRCDITAKSWKAPAKPATCDLDWGNGLSVDTENPATEVCAGDTVMGAAETLPYGESAKLGNFLCESASTGIKCENTATGNGFTMSRQSYRIY